MVSAQITVYWPQKQPNYFMWQSRQWNLPPPGTDRHPAGQFLNYDYTKSKTDAL